MVALRDARLHPDVVSQLDGINLDTARPLVISDADEVLFDFMTTFEMFLGSLDLFFSWESFGLDGNIIRRADNTALTRGEGFALLDDFFEAHTASLETVPGAVKALDALAERAQVMIVSNLPIPKRHLRRQSLDHHGMVYPLVANTGPKGPIVRSLAHAFSAPVFFIDDSPRHIASVAECADAVHRIHFVGHERLATLIGPAPDCHHRIDTWPEARAVIEGILDEHGF